MATNRFGYSDDFVLNNGKVGINSASPQEKLDVVSVVKGDRLKVAGVSSFTVYEGFLNSTQNIVENVSLNSGNGITGSLSGEVIVGTGITVTGIGSAISTQNYIESLKVYNTFTVPVGGTADRPTTEKAGILFFNRDFGTIEFWDGDRWRQVDNTTRSGRGVIATGNAVPNGFTGNIEFINISSTGNSVNFGVSTLARQGPGGCSSSTRGLFGGGYNGPAGGLFNVIDYVTIQSEGNSIDFGDLTISVSNRTSCSSSIRGIWAGGANPTNVVEYVQIATIGNALDFGDLTLDRQVPAGLSSPTRGVFGGGIKNPVYQSIMDFVTISSTGNAVKFGDLTQTKWGVAACSNPTRGVFGGGYNAGLAAATQLSSIDYITISTTGNSQNFGDLTFARNWLTATSTQVRGVFISGRYNASSNVINIIDYITISTFGNAQDFGDLSVARQGAGACSDSHGGLGGF
jgi:hypothetical protein